MASFDLQLLRSFVVLSEELHFGRAANRLVVAQPALSRRIARLEAQLGLQLAERDSRGVRLTPAGEAFARHGRAALDLVDRGAAAARNLQAEHSLTVAWNPVTEVILAPLLERARTRSGRYELGLRGLVDNVAMASLRLRDVDLAITFGPKDEGDVELQQHQLIEVEHGVAIPEGHPLSKKDRLTRADLEPLHMTHLPRMLSPILFELLIAGLRTERVRSDFIEISMDAYGAHSAMTHHVATHGGFAPVSAAVMAKLHPAGLAIRLIDPPLVSPMWVVHQRDARPDVHRFVRLLLDTVLERQCLPIGCFPLGTHVPRTDLPA